MPRRQLTDAVRRALSPILDRIDTRARHQAQLAIDEFYRNTVDPLERRVDDLPHTFDSFYRPPVPAFGGGDPTAPFMVTSTPTASDIMHPRFAEIVAMWGGSIRFHRKLWEHVYITHHLLEGNWLRPGMRGLGFGVGREPLPAVFAALGCHVMATDAPPETAEADGWSDTDQFSASIDQLINPSIVDPERFAELVEFRTVDMNDIDDDLTGFDFAWSSCCFEHLGSLRHGLDFVINSTERCLRAGGIGIHTTEYNLSSNTSTLERPELSFFRHRDLEELTAELTARGHRVEPIVLSPDSGFFDNIVDTPPYRDDLHLKIRAGRYTATSIGIIVERGPH